MKPIPAEEHLAIADQLNGLHLDLSVQVSDDHLWLRYDFYSCDPDEQWENYICLSDDLKRLGFVLNDPCVEHDCISGDLCRIDEGDT